MQRQQTAKLHLRTGHETQRFSGLVSVFPVNSGAVEVFEALLPPHFNHNIGLIMRTEKHLPLDTKLAIINQYDDLMKTEKNRMTAERKTGEAHELSYNQVHQIIQKRHDIKRLSVILADKALHESIVGRYTNNELNMRDIAQEINVVPEYVRVYLMPTGKELTKLQNKRKLFSKSNPLEKKPDTIPNFSDQNIIERRVVTRINQVNYTTGSAGCSAFQASEF